MNNYKDYITIYPEKGSEKPCIKGKGINVYDMLTYLAAGMSNEDILKDFSKLTQIDILACLAYNGDSEKLDFVIAA